MNTQRVFLTGATGFVGSHVAELLSDAAVDVSCAIRPTRDGLGWIGDLRPKTVRVSLTDRRALEKVLAGFDTVIHVAGITKGRDEAEYMSGNARTTGTLVRAARASGVRRFCYVSSLTAVGPNPDGTPVDEQTPCHPLTAYGRSKRAGELSVLACEDTMETVILRPPAVYGPRDRDVFEFFRWASRGIKPLLGSSRPRLSIVHVRDLASAIVRSALGPHPGGTTYFVSDPATYTYDDLFVFLSRAAGRRLRPLRIPGAILTGAAWFCELASRVLPSPLPLNRDKLADLLQPCWTCSPSAFEHDTGFRTRISGAEGFESTYEWYRAAGWIS